MVKQGYINVITVPIAGDIFVNSEHKGTKNVNIPSDPDNYTVSFGDVLGYVTPSNTIVDVRPGP